MTTQDGIFLKLVLRQITNQSNKKNRNQVLYDIFISSITCENTTFQIQILTQYILCTSQSKLLQNRHINKTKQNKLLYTNNVLTYILAVVQSP